MTDFTPLNNFFDHIYVISLKRAKERQIAIKANLSGLNYEFFWGADKMEHSMDQLANDQIFDHSLSIRNHRHNKSITHGHVCCSWSHRNVYHDMVKNGYQKVLILEDDVISNKGLDSVFPLISKELPENWELLYLDYDKNEKRRVIKQKWYHIQKFFIGHTWSHQTFQNLYPVKISEHLSTAGYHDFTSAYAITSMAARKLIALQTPISFDADRLLAYACTNKFVNGYIARPKLFTQLSQGIGSDSEVFSYVAD